MFYNIIIDKSIMIINNKLGVMMKNIIKIILSLFFIYCIVMGIYSANVYNNFVTANENIENQFGIIESKLQRRYDLIPNLVSTVKGYMKQEDDVIKAVSEANASLINSFTIHDKFTASNRLDMALSRFIVLMNNYPDLKADKHITALMDELAGTENRIATSQQEREHNE